MKVAQGRSNQTTRQVIGQLSGLLLSAAAAAWVEDHRAYEINIPAQRLNQSLQALADVSGARFAYEQRLNLGVRTLAIDGEMSVGQALNRMLMGTGLDWRFDDHGRYFIHERSRGPQSEPLKHPGYR